MATARQKRKWPIRRTRIGETAVPAGKGTGAAAEAPVADAAVEGSAAAPGADARRQEPNEAARDDAAVGREVAGRISLCAAVRQSAVTRSGAGAVRTARGVVRGGVEVRRPRRRPHQEHLWPRRCRPHPQVHRHRRHQCLQCLQRHLLQCQHRRPIPNLHVLPGFLTDLPLLPLPLKRLLRRHPRHRHHPLFHNQQRGRLPQQHQRQPLQTQRLLQTQHWALFRRLRTKNRAQGRP
mmetsp:Transcript_67914/g.171241  ORF Transcript_67914/g.171241 Transcript_67914/m.171241 type:complete len:236 (+) Transcript_67914:863-1570(+)